MMDSILRGSAPPMDLFVGQSEGYPSWRVFQMPTLLRWDGEETWGHTEVSLPQSRRPAD